MTNTSPQHATLETPALSTKVFGSGPGIVLAHGAGGGIEANFGSLIPLLADGHTVTGSDYPADDTHLELDALADALVAEAATERFAIVAFSLGTAVAVRAAIRHPDRVNGLVLAAGTAYADNRLRVALDLWGRTLAAGDREAFARVVFSLAFSTGFANGMPPEAVAGFLEEVAGTAPGGTSAQADLVGRIDTRGDLAYIAVPTLVVSASEDQLVDPASHRYLAEQIQGAEYAEIQAGHVFMAERPDTWHELVLDFLQRHRL
ncbi:alpha/beta hydrolase [Kribbella sp. NBC_01245]|uniref:alpha/beta fold hydrolase n=1 Tax=Kribbella sp. NBC_01245 TaxID=2903578 RepID=UPI002E2DA68D|nr:alpha/beta hydrolase [Kribbella sp. NBC_01245]